MLDHLLRAGARHRRLLAALTAALCVLALSRTLSPAPPPTQTVLVAAQDLPGGRPVTDADVRAVRLPLEAVPARALTDPRQAAGRTLAGPHTRGTPLTEVSLVAPRSAPEGRVLAPIRIADAGVVALVSVGDRVDVLAATDAGASVVATAARVAALPAKQQTGGFGGGGDASGALVVVEVTPAEATALAQAATGRLQLALR